MSEKIFLKSYILHSIVLIYSSFFFIINIKLNSKSFFGFDINFTLFTKMIGQFMPINKVS